MAYRDFKDSPRRTASDKVFNIAKNPKCDVYQREPASLVYKCFDKKASGSDIKSEIMPNQQWTEELHKPNIRKLEKQ